jgi:nucleotide-binding universal stress UspA family protein
MWRTILVPLDGTAFGEAALPYALRLARQVNAGLRLVHAFPPDDSADMAERAAAYVRKLGVCGGHIAGIPVRVDILNGPVEPLGFGVGRPIIRAVR